MQEKERIIVQELIARATIPPPTLRQELNHFLNVWEWLLRLSPDAERSLRYAALLHDCDRLFPSRAKRQKDFRNYERYKRAHAKNCVVIADAILKKAGVGAPVREKTAALIGDHEWGTAADAYTLMAADSLSFFEVNLPDYFRERGKRATARKIAFMHDRLKPKERRRLTTEDFLFKHMPKLHRLFVRVTRRHARA